MIIFASDDPGAIIYIKRFLKKSKYQIKEYKNTNNINNLKSKIKLIITGAALGNSIDKKLILWAKKNKILSISIIEHWTFFKKRFYLKGKFLYPDFIFVNDNYAKKKAIIDGLPKNKIIISGNEHLKDLVKKKTKNEILNNKKILFVSEPITESHSKNSLKEIGYDEFRTLDFILKHRPKDYSVTVKLHPKENKEKFFNYKKKINLLIKKNLNHISRKYKIIIGMTSMLLIELGIYRNDIISLRIDSKDNFYGDNLGLTKKVKNKKQFVKCFQKKPKNNNELFIKNINSFKKNPDIILNRLIKIYKNI